MSEREPQVARRQDYRYFLPVPTRWMDNDVYGHVNNVVYYAYFDTVVNEHLIREAGLDIRTSPVIGVVVETQCHFHQELSFPEIIDGGIRVTHLGRSSVVYAIALFRQGADEPAATGRFVHVYIDRQTRAPVPVPEAIRRALEPLRVS